jgi:hypothetical protein
MPKNIQQPQTLLHKHYWKFNAAKKSRLKFSCAMFLSDCYGHLPVSGFDKLRVSGQRVVPCLFESLWKITPVSSSLWQSSLQSSHVIVHEIILGLGPHKQVSKQFNTYFLTVTP